MKDFKNLVLFCFVFFWIKVFDYSLNQNRGKPKSVSGDILIRGNNSLSKMVISCVASPFLSLAVQRQKSSHPISSEFKSWNTNIPGLKGLYRLFSSLFKWESFPHWLTQIFFLNVRSASMHVCGCVRECVCEAVSACK